MQKFDCHGFPVGESSTPKFYLASEVDARIAELEAALRELVEQADDYFYGDSGFPFKDAVDRAKSVL